MELVVKGNVLEEVKVTNEFKNFSIPSGIEELKEGALFRISNDIENLFIPKSVKKIPTSALFGEVSCFESLKTITVEDGNEFYKSEGNCLIDLKTNTVILGSENAVIPNWVEKIGVYAFRTKWNLKEVTIPKSVKEIDCQAFANCANLNSVVIESENTYLNDMAFIGCTKIKQMTIPKNSDYEFIQGCLIQKSTNTLLMINEIGVIPSSVTTLDTFSVIRHFADVVIPETVTNFKGKTILIFGNKVIGKKDSAIINYAKENDIDYIEN